MSDKPTEQHDGYAVVFTADRTSMADFRALFGGMLSASQTTRVPGFVMSHVLSPPVPSEGLRAVQAPLGLRRVEAALLEDGWEPGQVAVVSPRDLPRAVGPATQIIGISSGDPLGAGMNSTTMAGVLGGEIYTSRWFRRLVDQVKELRRRAPHARTVMGGPGAWQLVDRPDDRRKLGIDCVVSGYCEANAAELVRQVIRDAPGNGVFAGQDGMAGSLSPLRGATTMGAVEVSRGCGLGCRFCTLGQVPMRHAPPASVVADVRTNGGAGVETVSLITEDIFRYGGRGARVRPEALIGLLRGIRATGYTGLIQTDHANVSSVEQYTGAQLRTVRRLLAGPAKGEVWVNLGVETAAGELLAANGGRPKMRDCPPGQWGELCLEQVRRLVRAGFFPLVSLVMGLPGERPEHVRRTRRWVSRLEGEKAAVFPVFYAPVDGRSAAFTVDDMDREHWRLFRQSYRLNFRWVPGLCWDNQSRGGVPLWRRLLVQAMSRGGTVWWKCVFAWKSGKLAV